MLHFLACNEDIVHIASHSSPSLSVNGLLSRTRCNFRAGSDSQDRSRRVRILCDCVVIDAVLGWKDDNPQLTDEIGVTLRGGSFPPTAQSLSWRSQIHFQVHLRVLEGALRVVSSANRQLLVDLTALRWLGEGQLQAGTDQSIHLSVTHIHKSVIPCDVARCHIKLSVQDASCTWALV